jgi:hypoxanthine phosphoribosyltransferase
MKVKNAFRSASYEQVEHILSAQEEAQRAFAPDCVVAVCRGGLIPASIVSANLAVPMLAIMCSRTSSEATWLYSPEQAHLDPKRPLRALVVDDFQSTGWTRKLIDAFMQREGIAYRFNVVFYDMDKCKRPPDIGEPVRDWVCFPWDARERKPANVEEAMGTSDLDIGGTERNVAVHPALTTENRWADLMDRTGFLATPGEAPPRANWFHEHSITHYVTPNLEEAIAVSKDLPVMQVIWWPAEAEVGTLLRAADFAMESARVG